jgi:hypothetical protein
MIPRALAFLMVLFLVGCTLGAGLAKKPGAPSENPILGTPIETTALDIVKGEPAKPAVVKPDTSKPDLVTPAPIPEAEPAPVISLPPEAIACEKKGDKWLSSGSGTMSCVHFTKDSGKVCQKQSQCEGYCLARSATCAPVTPMFGCNEILQNDGVRSTICLD